MRATAIRVIAVVAALCILNLFCTWYYNPTAYDHSDARATDTVREAGAFTSRATEGNAWAVIDANGYNNTPEQLSKGRVAVLMMGSSHTEALNVAQTESASYLLNKMLVDKLNGNVYNIGISAHRFARNAANLDRALAEFSPTDYVIVEATDLMLSVYELESALSDSFERQEATDIPLPELLYNQPLAKTAYNQMQALIEAASVNPETLGDVEDATVVEEGYQELLTELIAQMEATADRHGVQLIIYYPPQLILEDDGAASADTSADYLAAFEAACLQTDITFINMEDVFLVEYSDSHILPHGFSNTLLGSGHLNAEGHRMIAETLYEAIMDKETAANTEGDAA